ncbi:hypothetical protein [Olsenella sp. An293]|uniref:hypothetical protein n=1 Tax=Olsenella sp. An293 TaxID=1965626 RepID=UPI000B376F81|nr:hypothetical protein [Olsenella sp. An293]OUO32246.1 hypothetical protein B5F85_06835 [Olsenella sp. An293]
MAEVRPFFKAKISTLEGSDRNGDPDRARVLPLVADGVVTRPLALHWSVRGGMCPLAVGDLVWCARSEDGDGIVLSRADGEWAGFVPGAVTVEGQLTGQAGGTFAADVTAAGISATGHTHTAPHGETSGPH